MSDASADSQAGERLAALDGRYELHEPIGRGAVGAVYAGRDLLTGAEIAVKILPAALVSTATARARFRREVASATALDHPHTVRVTASGELPGGGAYLVMERLHGVTLAALLAQAGALPLPRAARITAQILEAMASAHARNIVHRDLKPSNVMLVDRDGDGDFVKVCDFGLAKVFDPDGADEDPAGDPGPSSTGRGELCGTPEYMAPEQACGEALDGRADLYAIAVMLFQMVVGRTPFQASTRLALVSMHISAAPPRPSALRPDLRIQPALDGLILRALAKDRRERPSSAQVFRADLLQVERDMARDARRQWRRGGAASEVATLPAGESVGPARGGDFRRRVAVAAGALALAVAVVAAVALAGTRRPRVAPPEARAAVAVAKPASVGAAPGASPVATPPPAVIETALASPGPTTREGANREAKRERRARPARARPGSATSAVPAAASTDAELAAAAPQAPDLGGERETPEAALARAGVELDDGRASQACALAEDVAARAPALAAVHRFLGRCYMRIGRPDEARASYGRYLELAPEAPDARFVRAIVERGTR